MKGIKVIDVGTNPEYDVDLEHVRFVYPMVTK